MNETKMPPSLAIISWFWIIVGALMFFGGAMALIAISVMPSFSPESQLHQNVPEAALMLFSIFKYFGYLAVLQLVASLIGITSGVGLLKSKHWARAPLEILSWLALIYIISFSLFWLHSWNSIGEAAGNAGNSTAQANGAEIAGVMALIVAITYSIPFVLVIIKLRSKAIRNYLLLQRKAPSEV